MPSTNDYLGRQAYFLRKMSKVDELDDAALEAEREDRAAAVPKAKKKAEGPVFTRFMVMQNVTIGLPGCGPRLFRRGEELDDPITVKELRDAGALLRGIP